MKIAYGVHGYGRGHAMRALAVLPELSRRHEILILAGSDAYDALSVDYDVTRIPTLKYAMNRQGRRSARRTVKRNFSGVVDLEANGPVTDMVADAVRQFGPDVMISDSEPWTHHVARRLAIPRISLDHFGILVHCRWPMSWRDRLICRLEATAYRKLMGSPQRVVIASFYDAPPKREGVCVVGPVLRPAVRDMPATDGDHLLVYFSNGDRNYTDRAHQALGTLDRPVWVYGAVRDGAEGNIQFRPLSNTQFIEDLASCHAAFATAGNQLISEAMHFGKPLLLMPEDSLEQRLNARMIEQLQYGMHAPRKKVSPSLVKDFLAGHDRFASRLAAETRDGQAEAVSAIERFAAELAAT